MAASGDKVFEFGDFVLAPKERLLLRGGEQVERTELVRAVWVEHAPDSAAGLLATYTARLRKALEPDRARRAAPRAGAWQREVEQRAQRREGHAPNGLGSCRPRAGRAGICGWRPPVHDVRT